MKLPSYVSESVKRRNPELYGAPVGAVVAAKPQQDAASKLGKKLSRQRKRQQRPIAIVTLIACRKVLLDDDNSTGGFKALRDAIASELRIDDGDSAIRWKYGQVESAGEEGTIVKIEML